MNLRVDSALTITTGATTCQGAAVCDSPARASNLGQVLAHRYDGQMTRPTTYPRLDESLLSHVPPFASLERKQIRTILDQATSRHLEAGFTVFEEGADADRFFILLDGYIRVVRYTPEGEQVIILHIPPGQLFGIAHAIGRTTYPATAIAASDSIMLSWPSRLFDDFKASYAGFATETYKTLGNRLTERNDWLLTLATQKVEQRVAKALLQMTQQSGRTVAQGIEIAFPISRQDLSEMTATTLHTVSRLLSSWEKDGVVKSSRKRITVCDCARLRALTEAEQPFADTNP